LGKGNAGKTEQREVHVQWHPQEQREKRYMLIREQSGELTEGENE